MDGSVFEEKLSFKILGLTFSSKFFATGTGNFGPLFVTNVFNGDSHELHKVWVMYKFAAT